MRLPSLLMLVAWYMYSELGLYDAAGVIRDQSYAISCFVKVTLRYIKNNVYMYM